VIKKSSQHLPKESANQPKRKKTIEEVALLTEIRDFFKATKQLFIIISTIMVTFLDFRIGKHD